MMQIQSKLLITEAFTTFKYKAAEWIQNASQIHQQSADAAGISYRSVQNILRAIKWNNIILFSHSYAKRGINWIAEVTLMAQSVCHNMDNS
jgi:quinol-cytochrome oxidoreductase complex cytochrome b subunit